MEYIIEFLKKRAPLFKHLFVFIVIGFVLFLLRDEIPLLLLTFVFIYLFNNAHNWITKKLSRYIKIRPLPVTILIYVVFLGILGIILGIYVPKLIDQTSNLVSILTSYLQNIQNVPQDGSLINTVISYITSQVDISSYISTSGGALISVLKSIGSVSATVALSLLLSFFFMVDKKNVCRFMEYFKNSKLFWMYSDTRYFFAKFARSFGKVIQNQILISFINSILSLIILEIFRFPNVLGLTVMIFILGLVPIAGVFISLVPLSLIAYFNGGWKAVIYIIVMIAILHALEGYVLNPKLMSRVARMPVFFTMLILILSENLMGILGLVIGIPICMFILDVLDVLPDNPDNSRREVRIRIPKIKKGGGKEGSP